MKNRSTTRDSGARDNMSANPILLILSVGMLLGALVEMAGLSGDGAPWDERLRKSTELALAGIVLGVWSYALAQIQSGRVLALRAIHVAAVPFLAIILAGLAAEYRIAKLGLDELPIAMLLLTLVTQVVAVAAIVGFMNNWRIGWYLGWLAIVLFVSASIGFGAEFEVATGLVDQFHVSFSLLGGFILGLLISSDRLLQEMDIEKLSELRRLNLLFAVSSLVALSTFSNGRIVGIILLVVAFLGRKRLRLAERVFLPWRKVGAFGCEE